MSIFISTDTGVTLKNVRDSLTDAKFPSASISGKVLDSLGAVLSPAITFTLTAVSGSAGNYFGIIADTDAAVLVEGTTYIVEIIINNSGDIVTIRRSEVALYSN